MNPAIIDRTKMPLNAAFPRQIPKPPFPAPYEDFAFFSRPLTSLIASSAICRSVVDALPKISRGPAQNVLGGRLAFSFSALSASLRTRVYRYFWHRTLNLMEVVFLFFLIRAAVSIAISLETLDLLKFPPLSSWCLHVQEASFRRQISMN
jgi:hypothetical protein